MTILILASALVMAAQPAAAKAAPDFSGLLNAPDNAIRSCKFVHRPDGLHLIIVMAKHDAGDAILIVPDSRYKSYNYIFSSARKVPRQLNITSSTLGKRDQIDIPLRTAMGLRADLMKREVEPIFTQNGGYSIYIGYGFRNTEEAEIYGACYATLGVK